MHAGWNSFLLDTTEAYRYFRLKHDDSSGCSLAEFQVVGVLYNDIIATATTTVDVEFDDGLTQ